MGLLYYTFRKSQEDFCVKYNHHSRMKRYGTRMPSQPPAIRIPRIIGFIRFGRIPVGLNI